MPKTVVWVEADGCQDENQLKVTLVEKVILQVSVLNRPFTGITFIEITGSTFYSGVLNLGLEA